MKDRVWPVLALLLLAVAIPTACVLWFMNAAITSERQAVRQRLTEAYRGQLSLVRARLEAWRAQRAAEIAAQGLDPAAVFARAVRSGMADSVVCYGADGKPAYPAPAALPGADAVASRAEWVAARLLEEGGAHVAAAGAYAAMARAAGDETVAARALQAQGRCLVRAGRRDAAIELVANGLRHERAADLQGRLIAADMRLMALGLMQGADRRRERVAKALRGMLEDYENGMPSGQRLFLMEEMGALGLGTFATLDAERLAARYLETGAPELWKLRPAGGTVALFRAATLAAQMRAAAAAQGVEVTPPGAAVPQGPDAQSVAAGADLPGWQLTLAPAGRNPFEETASRQMAMYLWIGVLAIAGMAALVLVAARFMRRQMRLARLKTDLVTTVSHELKTPLSSMRLLVETLLDEEQPDAARTREYLELIARENARLSRLIENFLTFSRMERNKHVFEFGETRPEAVVAEALDAVRERFAAPGCRLDAQVAPDLGAMRADHGALVTVLVNLLDNAWKYSPGEKDVLLRAWSENGSVCFAVRDQRRGLPAEGGGANFSQVLPDRQPALARNGRVRAGVEHRGLHRESARRARGGEEPAGRGQHVHGGAARAGVRMNVLIVEDDDALLRGLKDNFAARGFHVITAQDGETGLEKALSSAPDLILLDIMLPKVNGYEICRAVRERGHRRADRHADGARAGGRHYPGAEPRRGRLRDQAVPHPGTAGARERAAAAAADAGERAPPVRRVRVGHGGAQALPRGRGGWADCQGVQAAGLLRHPRRPRAGAERHPQRGVGQLGDGDAAQRGPLRDHAAGEDRGRPAPAGVHSHDQGHRISFRAGRRGVVESEA